VTAAEWIGIAFLLSMFMISSCGQLFWSNVNKRLQPMGEIISTKRGLHQKYKISEDMTVSINEEAPLGIICNAMDIFYVLEMNLTFSWYKRDEPFPVNDNISVSAVKRSLIILLSSIKEFTPHNH